MGRWHGIFLWSIVYCVSKDSLEWIVALSCFGGKTLLLKLIKDGHKSRFLMEVWQKIRFRELVAFSVSSSLWSKLMEVSTKHDRRFNVKTLEYRDWLCGDCCKRKFDNSGICSELFRLLFNDKIKK